MVYFQGYEMQEASLGVGVLPVAAVVFQAAQQGFVTQREVTIQGSMNYLVAGEAKDNQLWSYANWMHGASSAAQCTLNAFIGALDLDHRLRFSDVLADFTIALASRLTVLRQASRPMADFVRKWRHAFQGGAEETWLLASGAMQPNPDDCGSVAELTVQAETKVRMLGHLIDEYLSFLPHARMLEEKLRSAGREVMSTIPNARFGLHFMAAQYSALVESKGLAGVEVFASVKGGFRRIMHDLNCTQVDVAKAFLGLTAWVEGNRVAILAETRLLTRAGTTAAAKVAMARARLACLPKQHPASNIRNG